MYGGENKSMNDFVGYNHMSVADRERVEKYFDWLEDLRKSGITNMYGAVPYLVTRFKELNEKSATEVLAFWMKHYEELMVQRGWTR